MTYAQWREEFHDEIFNDWMSSSREKSFELFAYEQWVKRNNLDYE